MSASQLSEIFGPLVTGYSISDSNQQNIAADVAQNQLQKQVQVTQ